MEFPCPIELGGLNAKQIPECLYEQLTAASGGYSQSQMKGVVFHKLSVKAVIHAEPHPLSYQSIRY